MLIEWPAMAFLKPWRHEAYKTGMKLENPSAGQGLRSSWAGVDSSLVKEWEEKSESAKSREVVAGDERREIEEDLLDGRFFSVYPDVVLCGTCYGCVPSGSPIGCQMAFFL